MGRGNLQKDRIEIYNPGRFPAEVHPEDFFKGSGRSILRNPLIAETMYKSRDIEKWASGLKRIHEECEANHVRVEFQQIPMGSVVVFHRPKWEEGEGLERVPEKVTQNQRKILDLISQNQYITGAELSRAIGISERKIKTNIAKLKEKGILRRIGPDKGGHWEIQQ